MKICTPDVIMEVKFKFGKIQGFLYYGVKFRPFQLTLHVGLTTVLRAACDDNRNRFKS